MLRRIAALVKKEFLSLFKDKKSRVVVVVPPIVQLLVFGYAATYDLTDVPFVVYNEDTGGASRELIAGFNGSPHFREVARIDHEGQIASLVDSKDALLVLHIAPRFSADLLRGRTGALQVIVDGRNSNTALIAMNYVRTIVSRFNRTWAERHGLGASSRRR